MPRQFLKIRPLFFAVAFFLSLQILHCLPAQANESCARVVGTSVNQWNFLKGMFDGDRYTNSAALDNWRHPAVIERLLNDEGFKKKSIEQKRIETASTIQSLFWKGRGIRSHTEIIDDHLWVILNSRSPSQIEEDEAKGVKTNYLQLRVENLAKQNPPIRIGVHAGNPLGDFKGFFGIRERLLSIVVEDAIRYWPSDVQAHEFEHYETYRVRMNDQLRANALLMHQSHQAPFPDRERKAIAMQIFDINANLDEIFGGLSPNRIQGLKDGYFNFWGYQSDELRAHAIGFKTTIDDLERAVTALARARERGEGPKTTAENAQVRALLMDLYRSTFVTRRYVKGFISHLRPMLREAIKDLQNQNGPRPVVEQNWGANRSFTTSSGKKITYFDYQIISLLKDRDPDSSLSPLKMQRVFQIQVDDIGALEKMWLEQEKKAEDLKKQLTSLLP
jgi:hypothetical protein